MSTTGTTTASKPLVRFNVPADVPALAQAAALGLAIVRAVKCDTWGEMAEKVAAEDDEVLRALGTLDITEEESALLAACDHVLRLLKVKPMRTVAVCPVCQAWVLVGGTPPTKCKVTLRCSGKPVKASIATRAKPGEGEPVTLSPIPDGFGRLVRLEEPLVEPASDETSSGIDGEPGEPEPGPESDPETTAEPEPDPVTEETSDFDFDDVVPPAEDVSLIDI